MKKQNCQTRAPLSWQTCHGTVPVFQYLLHHHGRISPKAAIIFCLSLSSWVLLGHLLRLCLLIQPCCLKYVRTRPKASKSHQKSLKNNTKNMFEISHACHAGMNHDDAFTSRLWYINFARDVGPTMPTSMTFTSEMSSGSAWDRTSSMTLWSSASTFSKPKVTKPLRRPWTADLGILEAEGISKSLKYHCPRARESDRNYIMRHDF